MLGIIRIRKTTSNLASVVTVRKVDILVVNYCAESFSIYEDQFWAVEVDGGSVCFIGVYSLEVTEES